MLRVTTLLLLGKSMTLTSVHVRNTTNDPAVSVGNEGEMTDK